MSTFTGETAKVHRAVWAFPTLDCARCGCRAVDPDRLYCECCIQAMGIRMAEDYADTNSTTENSSGGQN